MNWKTALRGALIALILVIVGITVQDWRGWFAIIALNLVCHLR